MPAEIPYMATIKNVPDILATIQRAGTPETFTHEFLKSTLGFGSSSDRAIIKVLKELGFLTSDGRPTSRYNSFRSDGLPSPTLAVGLREGWSEVFLSHERAHELSSGELKSIFMNLTGKGEKTAEKMAATFRALAERADWDRPAGEPEVEQEASGGDEVEPSAPSVDTGRPSPTSLSLRHDIHVHLPPNSDFETYASIFRALREELISG